jgi:7,8-dihydro-6-hydroxymethylpterin dimethyltransferase
MIGHAFAHAKDIWRAFWDPVVPDEREAARNVWEQLPDTLKVDDQALGRHSAGCAATYGVMEACDFKCTACYLADSANSTPPLPFDEVRGQLDAIRDYLGPWGNTQITAGEVTLLPCDDLVRILKYCQEVELSAMVMTHGQNLLQDPKYLERLVIEGGLRKVSIHVDTTQKGRRGMHARDSETDIHWIRDAFANLVRQTRRTTGQHFAAATTYTVTEKNFDEIPSVMDWCMDNADAFRMISFQPTADVGRNRESEQVGKREALWQKVCDGVGVELAGDAFKFGHPKCNSVSMMFVAKYEQDGEMVRHVMPVTRPENPRDKAFFESLFNDSFAGFCPDGEKTAIVLARLLGRLRKKPTMALRIPSFSIGRVLEERDWVTDFLKAVMTGKRWSLNPFVVIVHNFMSSHELETAEGQERLQACAFRVPVDGRMVSMCELNGTDLRKALNHDDQDRLVTVVDPIRKAS